MMEGCCCCFLGFSIRLLDGFHRMMLGWSVLVRWGFTSSRFLLLLLMAVENSSGVGRESVNKNPERRWFFDDGTRILPPLPPQHQLSETTTTIAGDGRPSRHNRSSDGSDSSGRQVNHKESTWADGDRITNKIPKCLWTKTKWSTK